MSGLDLKVGDKVRNELDTADGKVLAKFVNRIVVEWQGGYYALHTLEGKFVGHWWSDERTTNRKILMHHPVAEGESNAFYNVAKPKPPVLLQRFRGDLTLVDNSPYAVSYWRKSDFLGVLTFQGVRVTQGNEVRIHSLAEFRETEIFRELAK